MDKINEREFISPIFNNLNLLPDISYFADSEGKEEKFTEIGLSKIILHLMMLLVKQLENFLIISLTTFTRNDFINV